MSAYFPDHQIETSDDVFAHLEGYFASIKAHQDQQTIYDSIKSDFEQAHQALGLLQKERALAYQALMKSIEAYCK